MKRLPPRLARFVFSITALLLSLLAAPLAPAQDPPEFPDGKMTISQPGKNTFTVSVQTSSMWEYALEATDDLNAAWITIGEYLPGDGGRHAQRIAVSQGAPLAFFHYTARLRPPGADGNPLSGDTLPDWDRIYSFNANTSLDTDGDGIPDYLEEILLTDKLDNLSFPLQVLRSDPADNLAGHPRDGAILLYLNQPLPASVTGIPAGFVRQLHYVTNPLSLIGSYLDHASNATGSVAILPGRKVIAFLPSPNLAAGSDHTEVNNYRMDFSTGTAGLGKLIPWRSEFSTVNTFDDVGPWVRVVRPGETAFEVAVDFAPVIEWSQPLAPATANAGNVTIVNQTTGVPFAVSVAFDYETNRMTLPHTAAFQPDTAYTVTLGTGFTNLMGKPLLHAFVWSFRTRPAPVLPVAGQGPYVTATSPGNFSTKVNPYTFGGLTLVFSEAMDASTLNAATVHLRAHGATADVTGAFSYDATTKTLTFIPTDYLAFTTRHELTLDAASIRSAAAPPQTLQAQAQFVFTTGPDPYAGGGGGGGTADAGTGPGGSSGSADPQQPSPLELQLAYGDPEAFSDAGASLRVSITLPDGSQREIQMPNATNELRTENTPEFPNGSRVDITPQFLKGSDNNPDEDEALEVEVNVTSAPGYEMAGQYYDVQIQQGGAEVSKQPLSAGGSAAAKPQQKAVVNMGDPVKCIQLDVNFPIRGFEMNMGNSYFVLGGATTAQVQDVDGNPTGVGAKMQEKITNAVIYLESFYQQSGESGPSWHEVRASDPVNLNWVDFKASVDANGKFKDTPIGFKEGFIASGYQTCQHEHPFAPCRVREHIERHEYRIQWQGKTFPNDGTGLTGAWTQEIIGYYINGTEVITSFTSTPIQ